MPTVSSVRAEGEREKGRERRARTPQCLSQLCLNPHIVHKRGRVWALRRRVGEGREESLGSVAMHYKSVKLWKRQLQI